MTSFNLRPLRDVLWEAQGGHCWICGARMQYHGSKKHDGATLDHLWPKGLYGQIGDIGVTMLAHRNCNELRGAQIPTDDDVRQLVSVWKRVDRHWLRSNLILMEQALRAARNQAIRIEIVRSLAGAA